MIGDIEDTEGNIIFDITSQTLKADVYGSVYDNSGAVKIIDGMTGKITGSLSGNVIDIDGATMVDTASKTITANTFTGDLYGDVYGNLTSDSVVYGTFSGDFNGTSYGEFFGDSTGTHNGDVIGDVTGNVTGQLTGSVTGELLAVREGADAPERLTGWNEHFQQWEWYGGVGNPFPGEEHDVARGPIILAGPDRTETALRANVIHYNGTEIIKLHTEIDPTCETAPATIRGHFDGNFIYTDGETAQDALTVSAQGTVLHPVNGVVTIGGYITDAIDCDVNIFSDVITVETSADEEFLNVKNYNGTVNAKTAIGTDNPLAIISGEGYNGTDFVTGGLFGIYADAAPTDTYVESKFVVSLPKGNDNHDQTNPRRLSFDGDGVLTVPVFKARGTTFADRDSMVAEAGMIIFNTSSGKFQGYTGTTWVDLH